MSPFFRSLKAYYSILRFGKDSFTWKNCSCLSLSERFLSNVGSTVVDQKLSVANPAVRKYLNHIMKTYDKIKSGNESVQSNIEIKPFIGLLENRLGILENISNLEELGKPFYFSHKLSINISHFVYIHKNITNFLSTQLKTRK